MYWNRQSQYVASNHLVKMIMPKSDEEVDQAVSDAKGEPIILDFYTNWMAEMMGMLNCQKVQIVRVNVDNAFELAERFEVKQVPCTMGFDKCGHSLENRLYGESNEKQVEEFLLELSKFEKITISSFSMGLFTGDYDELHSFHKYYLFTNEPIANKPVKTVPGIGDVYASRLAQFGIRDARQLVAIYMQKSDPKDFQLWLQNMCKMNDHWCKIACKAIGKNVKRMM